MIERLDHVNLRTTQVAAMITWYEHFLQLKQGFRPSFPDPGAWLYAGDIPVVHLVPVKVAPPKARDLSLEHAAFFAKGLAAFLHRLSEAEQAFHVVPVPDIPLVQVNVWDPDGNHLHVDFHADEAVGVDLDGLRARQARA